jgi:predicted transcriptional regulator
MKRAPAPPWTFLTNHAHVLFCVADAPDARVRDVALRVGITERAVIRILGDLAEAGYVRVRRDGRRNRYAVNGRRPLRHPIERHRTVRDLVGLIVEGGAGEGAR